ncbi:MAG: transcriptional repressor [Candidatus Woesearchaeota archaeon]
MTKSRNTKQKGSIREEISQFKTFFTAEDLYEKVKSKKISLATVYRFLQILKNEGELYSYLCDRRQIYSKEKKSHCHFICEETGKIIHFEIDNLDFLKNKIPGKITSFQIEVKGLCGDCCKN